MKHNKANKVKATTQKKSQDNKSSASIGLKSNTFSEQEAKPIKTKSASTKK